MGLTKQYLRYLPLAQFGVIGSSRCNILYLNLRNTKSRFAATASCEHVNIWDVKTMQKVMVLQGEKHEVTCLAGSPDKLHLAVGYSDGSIRIFSLLTSQVMVTYNGHRSAVSCLVYDHEGMRLASGSNDTELVVWDLVNESGLYRLKGHKGPITKCYFIKEKNFLISSSKDTFIKWWDLDTQHCFKTMMGHRAEVWDFVLTLDDATMITGSSDSELRVWKIAYSTSDDQNGDIESKIDNSDDDLDSNDGEDTALGDGYRHQVECVKIGSVMRKEVDRVVSIAMSADGQYITCHGNSKFAEVFKVRTEDEVAVQVKRRVKKLRKKMQDQSLQDVIDKEMEVTAGDKLAFLGKFRCPAKIRATDLAQSSSKDEYHFISLLANNQIDIQNANPTRSSPEFSPVSKLSLEGHRGDCKSACFTSDGLAMLTASSTAAKVWNRASQRCIRTSQSDHPICCAIVPGDKQFIVGTADGNVEIHDIPSGKCMESVDCHSGAVSSLCVYPNKQGMATGSKDKSVKFWDFDLTLDEKFSTGSKRLTISHSRTLQLDDEVMAIEFSSNRKLLACALLDCTVKVFFVDTLKFFLSLYGHSLPVSCMSISHDSTIIATGSADRNIKLWGLDFGDCHKSIFAHDDSITALRFVPDSHLLFSCGRDGLIKQWDADKFIFIQTLQGHHGPIWCLDIDHQGDYVLSCGGDRSIRLWSRSTEIVIPDEEREREREEEDEERLVKNLSSLPVAGEAEPEESGMASRATIKTIKGAESIMEALELYREIGDGTESEQAKIHPILMAYGNISASRYVLEIVKKVKSSELEESLLVLPFSYVPDLLKLLNKFVVSGWEVELSCRCLFFLLKIHMKLITSSQMLVPVLQDLQQNTELRVQSLQDSIGFNIAALNHMKRQMEAKEKVTFFADATQRFNQKVRKRKRKHQPALLTM